MESSDVVDKLLRTMIEVIGRRTSQDYAVVMVKNTLQYLQESYPFLQFITVKSSQYSELESLVHIDSSLNVTNFKDIGSAMHLSLIHI